MADRCAPFCLLHLRYPDTLSSFAVSISFFCRLHRRLSSSLSIDCAETAHDVDDRNRTRNARPNQELRFHFHLDIIFLFFFHLLASLFPALEHCIYTWRRTPSRTGSRQRSSPSQTTSRKHLETPGEKSHSLFQNVFKNKELAPGGERRSEEPKKYNITRRTNRVNG